MRNLFKQPSFLCQGLLSSVIMLAASNLAYAVGHTLSLGSRTGVQDNYAPTTWSSLSADGRYTALTGSSTYFGSVFLYDRLTQLSSNIIPTANGVSTVPEISSNGRYLVFRSSATNLISNDSNGVTADIFVYDTETKRTEVVSKNSNGVQGNNLSHYAAISADGNVIAFSSEATNLVSKDTNGYADVFVHNRKTGRTVRASVSSAGVEADTGIGSTGNVDISADGRYVVFTSSADNLVSDDAKSTVDVFVYDVKTKTTTLISKLLTNTGYDGQSKYPSISADGRFIAYQSGSTKLVADDSVNFTSDIFVYDRLTQSNRKITVNADNNSVFPSISADGRYVAFYSQASNLVADDSNGHWDSFVYDRRMGTTKRINLTSTALQSTGDTYPSYVARPDLSADGRFISFETGAKDLTADDTDSAITDVFLRDTLANSSRNANVGIALSAPTASVLGQPVLYTVTVNNAGAATAAQTNVIMQLPTSLTAVSLTPSQGSCVKGVITVCRLGAVAKGAQPTIQLTVKSLTKGIAQVSATAQSGEIDSMPNNNSVMHSITIN